MKRLVMFLLVMLFSAPCYAQDRFQLDTRVAAPPAFARTWKSSDGVYSLDAEYVGAKDGTVSLRKPNGDVIKLPLARLSAEDQAYVAKQAVATDESSTTAVATPSSPQKQRFSQLVQLSGRLRTASEVLRAYKLFLQDDRIAEPDRKAAEEQLPVWEERAKKRMERVGSRWLEPAEANDLKPTGPDTISTKSSAATPSSRGLTQEVGEDLAAALEGGHVALEAASGNGASSGFAVDAYLINQRNTEVSLDVSLRQPLFLRNQGRGQNMFVIQVYLQGGGYVSDGFRSFISLQPKRRTPVQFIAYCADFDKDNPSATEKFVRDVSPVSLLPLFQSISNYELSHPDQDVTIAAQTAIWLAQGVSIEEVRTKFEVNRDQELLAREFLK